MLSVAAAFALSLPAPATPAALVSLGPPSPVLHKPAVKVVMVKGPTCLSWEASFREMATEHEDWNDLDPAMCDGFAALEEEPVLELTVGLER